MRAASSPHSFDHLVGAGEHRRWHLETERLRGFEIDHELIFVRRLDQFGWLLALENSVDVLGCAPVLVGRTRPVANQAAIGDERRERIDRWQSIAGRKRNDEMAVTVPRHARSRCRRAPRPSSPALHGTAPPTGLRRTGRSPRGWFPPE